MICVCLHVCADVRGMGVVAGAVVGVSFGVLLIILIIWLVFRKKEMKKYEEEETPNEIRLRKYSVLVTTSESLLQSHDNMAAGQRVSSHPHFLMPHCQLSTTFE